MSDPTDPAPTASAHAVPPLLVDAREAARLLCVSSRKLWSLTASAEIHAVRIGRLVRYDPRDLAAYIDGHRDRRQPWRGT